MNFHFRVNCSFKLNTPVSGRSNCWFQTKLGNVLFPLSSLQSDRKEGRSRPVWPSYLRPPAGQNKVGVDVLLSELLCDVEPQRAVLVVDVLLGGVAQDGVGVVDFLKLVGRLGVVRVLVWVKLQRQFPVKTQRENL